MQDADAAVALNLFSSRVQEQKQSCHQGIEALAAALPGAIAALQAYDAVHSVADQAASAARAAHQQVLDAQVCAESGLESSCAVKHLTFKLLQSSSTYSCREKGLVRRHPAHTLQTRVS